MKPSQPKSSGTGGSRPVSHATNSGARPKAKAGPTTPSSAPPSLQRIRGK